MIIECNFFLGVFSFYDFDKDGFIIRNEMQEIVEVIYYGGKYWWWFIGYFLYFVVNLGCNLYYDNFL